MELMRTMDCDEEIMECLAKEGKQIKMTILTLAGCRHLHDFVE